MNPGVRCEKGRKGVIVSCVHEGSMVGTKAYGPRPIDAEVENTQFCIIQGGLEGG